MGFGAIASRIPANLEVHHEGVRGSVQNIHSACPHIQIGYFHFNSFVCLFVH